MIDEKLTNISNPDALIPVHPEIEKYEMALLERTDHPVLLKMESLARKRNFPIVGRLVGVFLETMARMINARRVFEFGSGYGYSAFWFAQAVGRDGQVVCSDTDQNNLEQAKAFLIEAGVWDKIDFKVGFAQDIFFQTEGLFDICYNDVDKGDYPKIWELAKDRIRPGGLYIADNVLWQGRVTMKNPKDIVTGWTEAIHEHNLMIFQDPHFDAFINPTRDGVVVARKKIELR